MARTRLMISALAIAATIVAGGAHAADLSPAPPPPPAPCCDNWYLRGFVGAGMANGADALFIQNPANSSNFVFDSTSYSDQPFIGLGAGYMLNNWLRLEATAEYRAKSRIFAFGHFTDGGGFALDDYEANLKSWIFLANAFIDLGTWDCWTPFVGAGVGGAYNTLADFIDINPSRAGFGLSNDPSEWHLAWAVYAGLSYQVSKSLSIDLTYRYLSFGSITGTINCFSGCNAPDSFKFDDLHSHDIMLGLRFTCCDFGPPPPRYVETPPPSPPPLRSRG